MQRPFGHIVQRGHKLRVLLVATPIALCHQDAQGKASKCHGGEPPVLVGDECAQEVDHGRTIGWTVPAASSGEKVCAKAVVMTLIPGKQSAK